MTSWIKRWPVALALTLIGWLIAPIFQPAPPPDALDAHAFGRLPVLHEGRVKPIESVARSTLLTISGKQTLRNHDAKLTAAEWLLEVFALPQTADSRPCFTIHDPDLKGLLGLDPDEKRFAAADFARALPALAEHAHAAAELDSIRRTRFQRAALKLWSDHAAYASLKNAIKPEGADNFDKEVDLVARLAAMLASNEANRQELATEARMLASRYDRLAARQTIGFIPNHADPEHPWLSTGHALRITLDKAQPTLGTTTLAHQYAALVSAATANEPQRFNALVKEIASAAAPHAPRAPIESWYNDLQPLTRAMALYVIAFLAAAASWVWAKPRLDRAASAVAAIALAAHTAGLIARMVIEQRPPVTNLYSSAVFVGWAAVLVGLLLERIFKNGFGAVTASAVGFATLIVADHLALSGDTMEPMRAVLDSNFWLATHVVTITVGYSATFLAGGISACYVLRRTLAGPKVEQTEAAVSKMVYGVVCFGLLFSFVGTVLGGIWADQSWGRFWGWDPKENGALMIVLWNAAILHARWGGIIRARGVMLMTILGNCITAFSWFGVNMLGVGLHSYGFMDSAMPWLIGFCASQVALAALGILPRAQPPATSPGRVT